MSDTTNYHLKNLHIQNFTCFKDVKLENIKRINMVFGKNGTGKTWLLRAVDLLTTRKSDSAMKGSNASGVFLKIISDVCAIPSGSQSISNNFRAYLDSNRNNIHGIFGYKGESGILVNENNDDQIKIDDDFFKDCFFKHQSFLTADLFALVVLSMYVDGETLWKSYAPLAVKRLKDRSKKDKLFNQIIKKFIPTAVDIFPDHQNLIEIFDSPEANLPRPIGAYGYGLKRAVLMFLMCMEKECKTLVIDEFENGLHFDKQKQVAESLLNASKQFNTQLFVTSHSQECSLRLLEAVESGNYQDDFSCFYLDRDEEGEIVVRQRDFESAKFILESWKDDEDHRFV